MTAYGNDWGAPYRRDGDGERLAWAVTLRSTMLYPRRDLLLARSRPAVL